MVSRLRGIAVLTQIRCFYVHAEKGYGSLMDQGVVIRSKMEENFNTILSQGAEYGDIRFYPEDIRETVILDNGNCEANEILIQSGIGVRVLVGGAWGFAAANGVQSIDECFQRAFANASIAAKLMSTPITMGGGAEQEKEKLVYGRYGSPVQKEITAISLADKLDFCHAIDNELCSDWIRKRIVRCKFQKKRILFWNTQGVETQRDLTHVFGIFTVMAPDCDGHMLQRSHTLFTKGDGARGWEMITSPQLFADHTARVKEELKQLITADELSYGKRSLILLPGQGFLQLHETIGHPLELDRILGYELSYAGGSFVTLDAVGTLRYGSEKLNVNVYGDIENSPGTFGYDDEGTPQHSYMLIEKGILVDVLSSRSSINLANKLAQKKVFSRSGATARANSFYRSPLERMSNLNILPGTDGTFDDIVAATEDGVIMDNPTSWSISSNRDHFHFGCEIAWEVKNGKITRILRNPSYQGHTLELYRHLTAVGDKTTWRVEQVENCGKGEPNQEIELGHGVPVLKFENVISGYRK